MTIFPLVLGRFSGHDHFNPAATWRTLCAMKNLPIRPIGARLSGLSLLAFVSAWLLVLSPVLAIEPDALRDKIAETFDIYNFGLSAEQGATYLYDNIQVVPRDDRFQVTLEGVGFLIDPSDQTRLQIGTVSFMMEPAGNLAGDDMYRISDLEMPSALGVVYGDGTPVAGVRLGDVSVDALWSFAYLTSLSLDLAVNKIEVVEPNGRTAAELSSLTADIRSDQKAGNRYDMTFNVRFDGLAGSEDTTRFEIGKIAVLSRVVDYDLAAAAAFYLKIRDKMTAEGTSEQQLASLFDLVMTQNFWQVDSETQFELTGMRVADGEASQEISIDSLGVGFALEDAQQALARTRFNFTQNGLKVVGDDPSLRSPLAQGLMPEQLALRIDMDRVPLKELMALFGAMATEAMASGQTEGNGGEDPALEAMMGPMMIQLTQLMNQARTVLHIRDSGAETSLAAFDMAGSFDLDPQAAFGVKGGLLANLIGLDALLQAAQEAMGGEDETLRDLALNVVLALGTLQAYTDRGETDQGVTVDRYDLKVEPSGQITVNGQSVLPAPQ